MKKIRVKEALQAEGPEPAILVRGWVRTRREAKGCAFLEINDGSCLTNLQAVIDEDGPGWVALKKATTGAAVEIIGALVPSPGKGQKWELKAEVLNILGSADPETYPLQKKRHSDEFLRTIAHLRPRTNKLGAMTRIRAEASFAVHDFFRRRGFYYIHSPIITGSDCEGAGQMFRVTTLPSQPSGQTTLEDFFGKPAFLTVSGQLEAEALAMALGRVYTFGPTFRAENSNTARHAAEFWMIEPEMAFADLEDDMDLAEDFLKALISHLREHCAEDLDLFARFVDKELYDFLDAVTSRPFVRLPHAEAVRMLQESHQGFEYPVGLDIELQTEHERYLTEVLFKGPVIVYNFPKGVKPFYMRINDDGSTVAAMDVLLPRVGEIIGGSQREERLEVLEARLNELGLEAEDYWWYLDLRRFGTAPHAGFGLGFERFLMTVTGATNIRDVIPFPRTPKNLEF